MDPEGTSRDDLHVRLDWPDTEPEGEPHPPANNATNGVVGDSQPDAQPAPKAPAGTESSRVVLPLESELEGIRATLRLLSARIEALSTAVESSRLTHHAVAIATERLEHSVTVLSTASVEAHEKAAAGTRELSQALGESINRMTQQVEALRKRITLRGRPDQVSYEEMIELIAGAVADRLSLEDPNASSLSHRRRRRDR
jgi:hypothetical protein